MLLNASIVVLENTAATKGLMLYLAVLCVLMAATIAVGIVIHRNAFR